MSTIYSSILNLITGAAPPASTDLIMTAFSDFTIILVAALIAARLASLLKIPDVILFLVAGVIIGPMVPFWVPIEESSNINQMVIIFGASYILFQGGLDLKLKTIIHYAWIIALLAIPGVLLSTFLVGGAAKLIFPILPCAAALLLGVILAPTDPATLIPILKQVRVSERLEVVIESESAFNDTTAAVIFISIVTLLQQGHLSLFPAVGGFLGQLFIGFGCGAGVGLLAGVFISHRPFGFFREVASILTLPVVAGSYTLATWLGGSGYLATFIAGVFLGNCRELMPSYFDRKKGLNLEIFSMDLAVICRMMIFVILGSQIDFLAVREYLLPGLVLMAVFIFISRPAVVFLFFGLDRKKGWTIKEKLFLSWVRETGVMPAALAGALASISLNFSGRMGGIYDEFVQAIVFMAILVTLLVQAMSTPWLARKLKLIRENENEGA
ncbi:MAG: sodium:proton antiporter [Candidatus Euphemobacter frigidus]|nr:sodium:proton antiporter [Candidatus Euphemobacter frigidus]MDP8275419.1 sodium:proton antiporter [Candidatus Euphemobacter frigidus]